MRPAGVAAQHSSLFLLLMHGAGTAICDSSGPNDFTGPKTAFHLAANGNFGARSQYLPGKAGFNLADVNSVAHFNSLPPGVKGLVWVGQCSGVDAKFIATVKPYIGNPKLFRSYLMDDPDPRSIAILRHEKKLLPAIKLESAIRMDSWTCAGCKDVYPPDEHGIQTISYIRKYL